ncbi:hypothetical protein [Tritonibacter scottomollicae]|uniref:Uncharacterized protein n=1 Tax=Tritonibacter scottomollicae TaxID=483013 RepID=A0A2T1AK34_TRISK|nr:hypothetical protein [Tritonibacter scottomollicae]PRZ48966.1 hypothetical protein CLV89_103281 [Tritonibacter scottomollicae]
MGDFFQQFVQSINERVRSPILGSVAFSLLFWNWRAVLVFFSGRSAQFKISEIEALYSFANSIFWPIFTGVGLALILPILTFVGAWAARWPKFWLHRLEQDEATKREINGYRVEAERLDAQTKFRRARADREAQEENELIARARRDKDAEDLGQEAVDELAAARSKNDNEREGKELEREAKWLKGNSHLNVAGRYALIVLGNAEKNRSLSQIVQEVSMTLSPDDRKLFGNGKRLDVEVEEALQLLSSEGFVKDVIRSERMFELTSKGYKLRDLLLNIE